MRIMLYEPHRKTYADDIDTALQRCKDMAKLIRGWAYFANQCGGDIEDMWLDGIWLVSTMMENTLAHVRMQHSGQCKQCKEGA